MTDMPRREPSIPADPPEEQALWEAYRAETAPVLRQRLDLTVVLFAVFMGLGTVLEMLRHPDRAAAARLFYSTEVLTGVFALGLCRLPALRRSPGVIGGATVGALAAQIIGYHALVGAHAERVAMVLICVLNLVGVMLPWGVAAQIVAALLAVATFVSALPRFAIADDVASIPLVALIAGATGSICGAFFLGRYRFEAFRRTAWQTEEAEIAETLVRVSETLGANLERPDMVERVNRLAVEALGCDWSSTFLFDDRRGVYWLAANAGSRPEVRTELAQLEFPPDSLPLLERLKPGTLVEIPDAAVDTLVPPPLMRRTEAASALYAPIARGEKIIGVLVSGYRERTGPFSRRQRRLALGIAHASAIALENGRLIADLQAASRLKSEFVATMSHELRTPLNVISGYAEMLADAAVGPHTAPWTEMVARIQHSAAELTDLVNATLDMGRLELGREVVRPAPLDIGRLLAELRREVEPLVAAGVALGWHDEVGPPPVMVDGVKVKTILKNLVGNALKFTSRGLVDVVVRYEDGTLVLDVRDTGIGIAPEHLSIIFDMFRQIDGSSTRRYSGVGLGLHIVKRLVDLMGGRIAVASTPGLGSRFTVTLPATRA
jgi:signal transduction histidine kinase